MSTSDSTESLGGDRGKLSVLIVPEGRSVEAGQFCGTIERHNTEETPLLGEKRGWSVAELSEDSVVMGEVRGSREDEKCASWHEGDARAPSAAAARRSQSLGASLDEDASSDVRLLRERLGRVGAHASAPLRSFSRRQRLTLASLALVDFMSFCSMSIMAPFFPREAAHKGMSDTLSGLVFGFYAFVMFLFAPVFGKILPIAGAKYLFMCGMFVAGVCNILFGTLELMPELTTFTVFCFVIRGLEALGAAAYSTASYVFVVNTFPQHVGSVLGVLETFVGLGMSVGPAIGGILYSVGGFGLPFYVLGVAMVVAVPVNYWLLIDDPEYTLMTKGGSVLQLLKIPTIVITGLVIVIISNIWAFLDPTLEPHLRQFNLSTQQIGLIFLLFSALYGIFSPIWGWLADRIQNHWCMMVWGLLLCTLGLLLLGPSPFIPGLKDELWLNLVALSLLGISVALTLLPTFQGVLSSSIYEGGCPEALGTYSVVAGVWSCCYSLGEVLGPAAGGAVVSWLGFPLCTTIMAAACFTMAVVTLAFFSLKDSSKLARASTSLRSSSLGYSGRSSWSSNVICTDPLLADASDDTSATYSRTRGTSTLAKSPSSLGSGPKSGGSVGEAIAYVLMFRFITDPLARALAPAPAPAPAPRAHLYQSYQDYISQDTLPRVKV